MVQQRVNGYQVECDDHDDRPWAGGIYEEAIPGLALSHVLSIISVAKSNKRGEWNQIRVEAVGNTIRTYINGVNFANLVDDGRKEGFIALQVHGIGNRTEVEGKEIRWRNIRILTEEPGKYMKTDVELAPEVSYLTNELTPAQKEADGSFSGMEDPQRAGEVPNWISFRKKAGTWKMVSCPWRKAEVQNRPMAEIL